MERGGEASTSGGHGGGGDGTVAMAGKQRKGKPGTFEAMGLSAPVLKAIKRKGFQLPTPIQRKSIPVILQGLDVVGMARTGSGKTAAFVVPMIERLKTHSQRAGCRAIILAPTRELALQTYKVCKELSRYTDLRCACLVGGDSMDAQFEQLASNPDVIVATPGRLMHHLREVDGFDLRVVEYCVFDEADRLFEMGFADQLKEILSKLPESRQTLLFSATMPQALAEFARAGIREPELVRLDADTRVSPDLSLAFFTVRPEDKPAALLHLIKEVLPRSHGEVRHQSTLVFVSTKHHVEFLHTLLEADGIQAACVYGSMDQTARKISVAKFRAGKVPLMIVTDVAARGIDIPLLDNVINYDFPSKPKLFVHRAGRAGRAGRTGTAFSLLTRDELPYLLDLHTFLNLPVAPAPVVPDPSQVADPNGCLRTVESTDPSLFGSVPQVLLDASIERVKELCSASKSAVTLLTMQRPLANATKLYRKTRPSASREAVARAKELGPEGAHPFLARHLPESGRINLGAEVELQSIAQKIRDFRPSATVFEAQVAPGRRAEGSQPASLPLPGASGGAVSEMMRKKRIQHDRVVGEARERKANREAAAVAAAEVSARGRRKFADEFPDEASSDGDDSDEGNGQGEGTGLGFGLNPGSGGRFQDAEFFIPYQPGNGKAEEHYSLHDSHGAVDDAVMDLVGEDAEGMRKARSDYFWDKKRRRYVKLQKAESVTASGKRVIKNEAGRLVKVKGGGTGRYKDWVKRTHQKVASSGSNEDAGAGALARSVGTAAGVRQKFGRERGPGAKAARSAGGDGFGKGHVPRDELKTPDQVRKERAIKAKRQGHEAKVHAQKAARGKVVGKPGQRVKGGGLKPRGGVVKKGRGGKGGKPRVGQKGRGKK